MEGPQPAWGTRAGQGTFQTMGQRAQSTKWGEGGGGDIWSGDVCPPESPFRCQGSPGILNTCPAMGSGEFFPCFALFACTLRFSCYTALIPTHGTPCFYPSIRSPIPLLGLCGLGLKHGPRVIGAVQSRFLVSFGGFLFASSWTAKRAQGCEQQGELRPCPSRQSSSAIIV